MSRGMLTDMMMMKAAILLSVAKVGTVGIRIRGEGKEEEDGDGGFRVRMVGMRLICLEREGAKGNC